MMKLTFKIVLSLVLLSGFTGQAQDKKFKIKTIASYNLENLFDTINDTRKNDEASPMMDIKNNRSNIYWKKVKNMAKTIAQIGTSDKMNYSDAPTIVGVSEIENKDVLVDLINDDYLKDENYGIIHYDSPDGRGIDVGMLYKKDVFIPITHSSHELLIYDKNTGDRILTRDQLLVSGKLDGDLIHLIVNHWPSRRGGEAKSRPKRVAAAKINKKIIDSLQTIDPYAKIIIMGDLNDDPINASVKKVLKAQANKEEVGFKGILNPMMNMYKKGLGTNAYRDGWSLFDQIMLTQPFLKNENNGYRYWKAGIYNKPYLTNKKGRYKGYPFRSFVSGTGFTGGYSDHFPVFVYLVKEVK